MAWWVIAAFVMSMVGDYFLSNRRGHEAYFLLGIAAYFLAHLGYLAFALSNGRVSWLALAILLTGYMAYYLLKLRPAIGDPLLSIAVLAYLLISCFALAAAIGLRLPRLARGFYVAGLCLIVLSDTLISFTEFLRYRDLNGLILPTYYLAHVSITLCVLLV